MLSYNFIPGTYLEEPTPHKSQAMFNPEAEANNIISSLRAMRGTASTSGIMPDPEFGAYQSYDIPEVNNRSEFTKGLLRGVDSTQALLYGGIGAVGDVLGMDSVRDWGYENYARNMEEAEENKAAVGSISEVNSLGSFGQYAMGVLGELAPTVAGALASGGIGALAGKYYGSKLIRKAVADQIENQVQKGIADAAAKGIASEAVESTLRKQAQKQVMGNLMRKGGTAAMGAYTSLTEGGGNWGQDVAAHGIENASPGQDLLFGVASGAIETILGAEISLFKSLTGKTVSDAVEQSFRKELVKGFAKAAFSEGGQEAIQETLSSINANILDSKGLITEEDIEGIFNAAVAGAIGGVAFHLPTAWSDARNRKKKTAAQAEIDDTVKKIEEAKAQKAEQERLQTIEQERLAKEQQYQDAVNDPRTQFELQLQKEMDDLNAYWDQEGKDLYSAYERHKRALENPSQSSPRAIKAAQAFMKKFVPFQEARNASIISLSREQEKKRSQFYSNRKRPDREVEQIERPDWDVTQTYPYQAAAEMQRQEERLDSLAAMFEQGAEEHNVIATAEEEAWRASHSATRAMTPARQAFEQKLLNEQNEFDSRWDERGKKIYSAYNAVKVVLERPNEFSAAERKKSLTALNEYKKFEQERSTAQTVLSNRHQQERTAFYSGRTRENRTLPVSPLKLDWDPSLSYTETFNFEQAEEERKINELGSMFEEGARIHDLIATAERAEHNRQMEGFSQYTPGLVAREQEILNRTDISDIQKEILLRNLRSGRSYPDRTIAPEDTRPTFGEIQYLRDKEEAEKLMPLLKARESQRIQHQLWKEYADKEEAAFKEEWDKKEASLLAQLQKFNQIAAQARLTKDQESARAQLYAQHAKFLNDKKKAKEALDAKIRAGYHSADGVFLSEARIAANKVYQQEEIDRALGSGAYDTLSGALNEASLYFTKATEAINQRVADINTALSEENAALAQKQKDLTLTSDDWKRHKVRIDNLTNQRGKALRSLRKMNKLMGDISKKNAVLSSADLNNLGLAIQELYHEGETILNLQRSEDIFRDKQQLMINEKKAKFGQLTDALKRARKLVENNIDQESKARVSQIFNNVENALTNSNFERDYPLQNPEAKTTPPSVVAQREQQQEQSALEDAKIKEDFTNTFNQNLTSAIEAQQKAKEKEDQDAHEASVQAATKQKKSSVSKEHLARWAKEDAARWDAITLLDPSEANRPILEEMARDTARVKAAERKAQEVLASAQAAMNMTLKEQENPATLASRLLGQNRKDFKEKKVHSVITFLKNTLKSLPGLRDNTVICYDQNDASIPLELKNMLANVNLGVSKGVKFLFTGQMGAYSSDFQNSLDTNIEMLNTAREMEEQGKDPKTILLATGWQRHPVDGKWRYEIDSTSFLYDFSELSTTPTSLEKVITEAGDLFDRYPDLRDLEIKYDDSLAKDGYYGIYHVGTPGSISIVSTLSPFDTIKTIVHEVQHAIQHAEGFPRGPSHIRPENFPGVKEYNNAQKEKKRLENYIGKSVLSETENIFNSLLYKMKQSNLLSEAERDILDPEFREYPSYANRSFIQDIYLRYISNTDTVNRDLSDAFIDYFSFTKDFSDDLQNYYDASRVPAPKSFDPYWDSIHEVEARNAERRLEYPWEDRRQKLIRETHDVNSEQQLMMLRVFDSQVKGAYYNGKLYIFAKNMEGKEDAIRTLIHEGVAHYGLRSIMNNEQLGQFLNLVFNSFANTDSWKKFAAARPEYFKTNDRLTQAEEYVAYIAEQMKVSELINPENQSIFNRIVMFLRNILSKLGLKTTLTHKDIRDVLKLSAYNLQKKGGQKDLISELNNIDMYQADQQNKEMTLSEEPVYGVKFDDVQNARSYFADADSARTGIPYTRFAKNEPNLTNTLNLNDSLDEQHDKIKTRIAKLARDFGAAPAIDAVDAETFYVSMFNRVFGPYPSEQDARTFIDNDAMLSSITGWDVYNFLASAMDSKRKATEIMNAYGIRGAQYLNMGKNTYYLFEGNNINTVPYQYDLNKLSEPKFLVTNPKDMVLDPETGEPTTKDTPDQWTYMNELFNQPARESSWLRKVASVIKTGTSRADDGSLIEHNGWERFVEGTVDRYRRLKVVQDYLKKKFKGAVDFTTNVYQNLQGLTNRISERQVDAANKYLKPIEDVLKGITVDLPIYKDGQLVGYKKPTDSDYQDFMLRLFDGFLHARHAQERNKSVSERFRGRRWLDKDGNPHHKNMKSAEQGQDIINASGMSDAEAQHLIDTLGSISGFQEAAALVDKMNRYTLETMLEMKLITQEDFNNMAKYNYYVPLTGWEDMVEHFAPGRYRPRGRSLSTGGKRPVQFAKGRDNKLPASPLLRSWQQMDDIIALGMRNEVMRGFGQLVKNTSSETELWEVDRKNPEAVRLQVTKNGDIILVTKPSELHGSGDSAVSYIDENGKPVRIVIKDKWLADAMRGENMAPTGVIVDTMRKYTGMMSKLMTSRNPLFTITNPIRDLATAYLNLGSVIEENQMRGLMEKDGTIQRNVFKEALTGNIRNILFDLAMADEGKKSFDASKYDPQIVQDVMDWRKNGGHTKSISVYDMQDRAKELRANIRKDGIKKNITEAMKYLDILSDTAENIVRFSVYRNIQRAFEENIHQRAKAEGWSSARVQQEIEMAKQKSANIALDCTVNFTKRGAWANVFNPLFAFSSASIQGFARIANNLWRPTSTPLQNFKRVSKFMAMGTCAPLMHGFICRAIMGDDEDGLNKYDKIPAYIKETNLIIPMPFGDGGYIKVPLPYGYNVFWSMGTTLDTVMAGHQHPADGALSIMKNALSNITPLDPSQGAVAFVPTIFKPLVELAANKNFAGAPIKPEGYSTDMLPEHMKSWERTPHGYKVVAGYLNFITGGFMTKSNIGALDISPETIEHLANSYLGGIYRIFSQATDLALSPLMGYQVEAKNIPLLNRLYGVTDDDNTRAIYNRYADHVRSAQVLKKQLKGTEEEKDLLDARRNVFSVEKQYTAVNTELNKVKQAKKDLAKRYPKRGEAYYNQLKLLEKREEKIMQKFNRVAHRAGLTME